ncbi:hypothetical protein B0H17DRAFT_560945 [Mycena rosella]|uniref:Uncharacterized protein n=1 Tax=Mycena rosella TaxID=1033263 RepID=A0AAD7BNY8_MYCRO|nr:hypothetical protein B0H17DRAFT_560945 [Mycena rosella]
MRPRRIGSACLSLLDWPVYGVRCSPAPFRPPLERSGVGAHLRSPAPSSRRSYCPWWLAHLCLRSSVLCPPPRRHFTSHKLHLRPVRVLIRNAPVFFLAPRLAFNHAFVPVHARRGVGSSFLLRTQTLLSTGRRRSMRADSVGDGGRAQGDVFKSEALRRRCVGHLLDLDYATDVFFVPGSTAGSASCAAKHSLFPAVRI